MNTNVFFQIVPDKWSGYDNPSVTVCLKKKDFIRLAGKIESEIEEALQRVMEVSALSRTEGGEVGDK